MNLLSASGTLIINNVGWHLPENLLESSEFLLLSLARSIVALCLSGWGTMTCNDSCNHSLIVPFIYRFLARDAVSWLVAV